MSAMDFKNFITENEKNMKDTKATLASIPKKYAALIKGYKFIFQADNTLKGDKNHVGVIDDGKKTITIAAPYNYGREFTILHELAHLVWMHCVTEKNKKVWHSAAKPHLNSLKDSSEEIFCMVFANVFCKNPVTKFAIPALEKVVKKII